MNKVLLITLTALLSGCGILPWPPEPIPVPPKQTSDELLTAIKQTASETTDRPARTTYLYACEDGTTLSYEHRNDNEGVLVNGYMVLPDGTTSTPNVNLVIRHAAMRKPYQQQINADPCYVNPNVPNVRAIPVIEYAGNWTFWFTSNNKIMYTTDEGADVYILRATAICLPDMGVSSPVVSVETKILTYIKAL